jgi:hypothetical protein
MKPKAEDKNEMGLLEYLEDIIDTAKFIEPIEQESKRWVPGAGEQARVWGGPSEGGAEWLGRRGRRGRAAPGRRGL